MGAEHHLREPQRGSPRALAGWLGSGLIILSARTRVKVQVQAATLPGLGN